MSGTPAPNPQNTPCTQQTCERRQARSGDRGRASPILSKLVMPDPTDHAALEHGNASVPGSLSGALPGDAGVVHRDPASRSRSSIHRRFSHSEAPRRVGNLAA